MRLFLHIAGMLVALANAMIGYCKLAMYDGERNFSCLRAFFYRVEEFTPPAFTVHIDARFPLIKPLAEANADNSRRIISLHNFVSGILGLIRFSKFLNSVVVANTVLMVNLIVWPFAIVMQPRKAMSAVIAQFANLNHNVAVLRFGSRTFTSPLGIPLSGHIRPVAPSEESGFWIVIKNGAEKFRSQFNLWHLHLYGLLNKISISQLPFTCNA